MTNIGLSEQEHFNSANVVESTAGYSYTQGWVCLPYIKKFLCISCAAVVSMKCSLLPNKVSLDAEERDNSSYHSANSLVDDTSVVTEQPHIEAGDNDMGSSNPSVYYSATSFDDKNPHFAYGNDDKPSTCFTAVLAKCMQNFCANSR